MKKVGSTDITYQQYMYTIVGTMVGVGVLALPNRLAEISKQDGWVSALIAAWYPLYIILITIYISKKFPNDNIFSINKKYFGKIAGGLLNLMFSIQFFIYMSSATAGFANLARLYIVQFLDGIKITIIILLVGLYGTFLNLKVIGRINELVFYILAAFLFFPLTAFRYGSLLNVSPFLGSGIKNIFRATIEAGFAYSGVEIALLIFPNVTDKKKLKSASLKSVAMIAFIYTYMTFLSIYYAGPDIISKPFFSVLLLNEAVNLPFLNNFMFIFMYGWSIILFKTLINYYYAFTYCISNSFLKLKINKVCFLVYPFALYAVNKYGNEALRRNITGKAVPYTMIFNLILITALAIIIHFRKGENNENL